MNMIVIEKKKDVEVLNESEKREIVEEDMMMKRMKKY